MQVFFYSLDNQNNKVSFNTAYKREDNKIIFEDKSIENTVIYLYIYKDKLILERKGSVEMKISFIKNKSIPSYYKNQLGLEFNFIAKCHKLTITENRIDIEYDMILDNDLISSHKIWIIMR